eukprot:1436499-Amphidinium_carterae.1
MSGLEKAFCYTNTPGEIAVVLPHLRFIPSIGRDQLCASLTKGERVAAASAVLVASHWSRDKRERSFGNHKLFASCLSESELEVLPSETTVA